MKTSVIILAAGQGKRMGTVKQLLPWGDTTVLGQSITCYNDINIDKLIIVVGYKADLIKEIFSFVLAPFVCTFMLPIIKIV